MFSQNFAEGRVPSPQMIAVPGSWSDQMSKFGSATYRLLIQNDKVNRLSGSDSPSLEL
ncbi:hypothetical protein [Paenibacillus sp. RC67]|uniref:hypothetical protein n=1 Tax=Paenibacillus sp. RC67 TaxID=3039392 RepID=UPI0024ACAB7B|nr:hypothetical protein [Paenibacillus sp. RC67]